MSNNGRKIKSDLKLIGTPMRKVEGLDKSTGRALYTDDLVFPGMLHGKILRSPHPHARIVSIDTSSAEVLDGVHGVVTGQDMPTTYGIIPWTPDEYPLCVDRVRYVGDGVAAVAAVDEQTASEVIELIKAFGRGNLHHGSAQAAVWHLNNDVSWGKLAAKRRIPRAFGPKLPYFTYDELRAATHIAAQSVRKAEIVKSKSASSYGSL